MDAITFACSICGEESTEICVYCTKDACGNHLCERCHRCSDCCACEMKLEEDEHPAHNGYGHVHNHSHDNGHTHLPATTFPPDALN